MRWKTAINVWGVVTKMFKDARSTVLGLRVRDDNPAHEVEGPDRGQERSGPYLFPHELSALVARDKVPLRWRRTSALAVYLYTRGGELAALDWDSVNFEQRYVHVHQAIDSDTGEVKSTKTKDVRKVPIEPTLMVLLRELHEDAADDDGKTTGSVIDMPHPCEWASLRLVAYISGTDDGASVGPLR